MHHIVEWSTSKDHSIANLAVLCLEHHDKAHTVSRLSRNLDQPTLRSQKEKWESAVCQANTAAILEASRADTDAWWYFNHTRVFELAVLLGVRFSQLSYYQTALSQGLISASGLLTERDSALTYMYNGGEGRFLYAYVRQVMLAVLEALTIFNISDDLDPGFLSQVITVGGYVFVQGDYTFKAHEKKKHAGRLQVTTGTRKANKVEIRFLFDRWEGTSTSAWSGWLSGRQTAGSIIRVVEMVKANGRLIINGSVLGIAAPISGGKRRDYSTGPYQPGVYWDSDDELSNSDDEENEIKI